MTATDAENLNDEEAAPPATTTPARRRLFRALLALFGIFLALASSELALHILDVPHFYRGPHISDQFRVLERQDADFTVYVNAPAQQIRFTYESNPRGYFDPGNQVIATTNSLGFRGREFPIDKPARTLRIAFLGDSFTFGYGVKDADIYAQQTVRRLSESLQSRSVAVEGLNFAVAGYNTHQELFTLRNRVLDLNPDLLVLGYVLNDTLKPIYKFDPSAGAPRLAGEGPPDGEDQPRPPDTILYKSRLAQLFWRGRQTRGAAAEWESFYKTCFEDGNPGWEQSRHDLREIVRICGERKIGCHVLCFPLLYELSDQYPFAGVHQSIGREATAAGASFLDLFPHLKGMNPNDLRVFPTDSHPNERVHRIAAERLADAIRGHSDFPGLVDRLAAGR